MKRLPTYNVEYWLQSIVNRLKSEINITECKLGDLKVKLLQRGQEVPELEHYGSY